MMSYAQELPMYWRARLEVFREAIAQAQNDDPDLALLRNGVMRNKGSEEMLSEARMNEKEFPNSPLSLMEVCSFNTWFAKHPEKVCGEEIITFHKRRPHLDRKHDWTSHWRG
jgi:hypothetical protein